MRSSCRLTGILHGIPPTNVGRREARQRPDAESWQNAPIQQVAIQRASARLKVTISYARPSGVERREIVGSITHLTGNERYAWLNNAVCAMTGEVRPRDGGAGFEIVFDVAELIWEPLD